MIVGVSRGLAVIASAWKTCSSLSLSRKKSLRGFIVPVALIYPGWIGRRAAPLYEEIVSRGITAVAVFIWKNNTLRVSLRLYISRRRC